MRFEADAETLGVRVQVSTSYRTEESGPGSFVFSYTIRISNAGPQPVTLRARHWIITDALGEVREVEGQGVVGAEPTLAPGQAFQYTSGCVLQTPRGTMHGTYRMVRSDGSQFDVEIPLFVLLAPSAATTSRWLN